MHIENSSHKKKNVCHNNNMNRKAQRKCPPKIHSKICNDPTEAMHIHIIIHLQVNFQIFSCSGLSRKFFLKSSEFLNNIKMSSVDNVCIVKFNTLFHICLWKLQNCKIKLVTKKLSTVPIRNNVTLMILLCKNIKYNYFI